MLKVFRENLKYLSWVLWLVIAVFVLFVFADFGSIQLGGTGAPGDAAATVGDLKVSYSEFERTYRQTEDYYRQAYGEQFNRELAQRIGLPVQVLDGLIADRILLAEADRMGVTVTNDEVARAIAEIPSFQLPDGRFIGEEQYRQALRSNGYTVDHFEESVRQDLLNDKVRSVLADNLYLSDKEVVESYRDRVETADIRYFRLPADQLQDEVVLTDADLAAYFSSHRDDFRIPARRVVDYLLIDPAELRTSVDLADAEVRSYYDDKPEEFAQDEAVRARHILLQVNADRTAEAAELELVEVRKRVESGEDFASLAAEVSEDPGSKSQGGDLGFFGRGQMIREFEDAAFGAQPGDLVGPISTSFGYHLIEVMEKRPSGRIPFEEAQDQIRNRLLTERSQSAAEAKARELANRVRKDKLASADQLRTLAETEPGVTVHTTSAFSREDNVAGIGRATAFTTSAFTLGVGESSEPVQVSRGWVILQPNEIQEPRSPELEEVREDVRAALQDERQLEMATARVDEARQAILTGQSFDDAAAELGLSIQESGEFGRLGPVPGLGNNSEIIAAALALDEGGLGHPVIHNRDVVLFEVTQRQRYDPAEFAQQKDQARENLRQERLNQMLTSLVTLRREELGVQYDTQLLQNFELAVGEG